MLGRPRYSRLPKHVIRTSRLHFVPAGGIIVRDLRSAFLGALVGILASRVKSETTDGAHNRSQVGDLGFQLGIAGVAVIFLVERHEN